MPLRAAHVSSAAAHRRADSQNRTQARCSGQTTPLGPCYQPHADTHVSLWSSSVGRGCQSAIQPVPVHCKSRRTKKQTKLSCPPANRAPGRSNHLQPCSTFRTHMLASKSHGQRAPAAAAQPQPRRSVPCGRGFCVQAQPALPLLRPRVWCWSTRRTPRGAGPSSRSSDVRSVGRVGAGPVLSPPTPSLSPWQAHPAPAAGAATRAGSPACAADLPTPPSSTAPVFPTTWAARAPVPLPPNISQCPPVTFACDHTTENAPDPVRSPKLSSVGLAQYCGRRRHGNGQCCRPLFCLFVL